MGKVGRVQQIAAHLTSAGAYEIPVNSSNLDGIDQPYRIQRPGDSPVNSDLVERYERDGFFLVKGLLNDAEVKEYTERFRKIANREVEVADMTLMKDVELAKQMKKEGRQQLAGIEEVTKIQDWQNDDEMMKYVRNPKILALVEGIIGPSLRSMHTMVINKPPDLGKGTSEHPMHQDLLYFPFRPANRVIASWTALQHIDTENGCLQVIPKSHKFGLFPHAHPSENGNMGYFGVHKDLTKHYALKYGVIDVPMEPGDTIFFHPCIIHGSGPNLSNKFRLAISCHYASGICNFIGMPAHTLPLIDEVLLVGLSKQFGRAAGQKIKTLTDQEKVILYQAVFKRKSKRITGDDDFEWGFNEEEMNLAGKILETAFISQ